MADEGYWSPAPVDRWWEHLEPAPIVDEWMARQVIAFHRKGEVPCATCSQGLVCERLVAARAMVGEASRGSVVSPGRRAEHPR